MQADGNPAKGAATVLERSVILVDKPPGMTSFDVVEKVSGLLGVRKAGHTGTLDPNATGLLVIALGEARKAMPVLTGLDKEYAGVMRLHADVGESELKKALSAFEGEITQTPPVRSAVARRPRKRTVHATELLGMNGRDARFRVRCQAGTYIRKIAHDLGEKLGCGAHLVELRRTLVGPFRLGDAVPIAELEAADGWRRLPERTIMPLEKALRIIGLPALVIRDEHEPQVRNGSPVREAFVSGMPPGRPEGAYAVVLNGSGKAVCLARFLGSGDSVAKTERVFLP
jgi:H/ACA ribonucleoprotein complex subunit 4